MEANTGGVMLCSCRDLRSSNSSKSNYKILLHLHTSVKHLCGCMFMHMHAHTDFVYTSYQCNFSLNNFYNCALILFFIMQYKKKIEYTTAYKLMPSLCKWQYQWWIYYTFTFFLFYYKLWIGHEKNIRIIPTLLCSHTWRTLSSYPLKEVDILMVHVPTAFGMLTRVAYVSPYYRLVQNKSNWTRRNWLIGTFIYDINITETFFYISLDTTLHVPHIHRTKSRYIFLGHSVSHSSCNQKFVNPLWNESSAVSAYKNKTLEPQC